MIFIILSLLLSLSPGRQQPRLDARTLAVDPANASHIFCGTVDGRIFFSEDRGNSWFLFTDLGKENVISRITFAKDSILVGSWNPFDPQKGAVWRYRNGDWDRPYIGAAVRAVVFYRELIVIGTLSGVFVSSDDGETWRQISSVKNVDSVAMDGHSIYIGTWHLAYKTTDLGQTWRFIDHGVANDSDVFSILADDGIVYLSACSGVYKSRDAGKTFIKMKGIPRSARRTRVLQWQNDKVVYAGTTEGLWKTTDGGKHWTRVTSADIVVNDILIEDSGAILLATDRHGVLKLTTDSK